jgi:hypothetical protein
MSLHLNSADAPDTDSVLSTCTRLFLEGGDALVMSYLAEVASNDYQCPDVCDAWACEFYGEWEDVIEGRELL